MNSVETILNAANHSFDTGTVNPSVDCIGGGGGCVVQ